MVYFNDYGYFYRDTSLDISNIQNALKGEYNAIICYKKLVDLAPDQSTANRLTEIRNDETKHYEQFAQLYYTLTGKEYRPEVTENCPATFDAGLRAAFLDEQNTVDVYLEAADNSDNALVKQAFSRAALDEQNHAVWFLYYMMEDDDD